MRPDVKRTIAAGRQRRDNSGGRDGEGRPNRRAARWRAGREGRRSILILNGYIGRTFIIAFSAVLLAIMGIILLFDMIELVRRSAANTDMSFAVLLGMALMRLPDMVGRALPFAVMLGGIIVFWRLTRSHELVVIRAAGVSAWQFLLPIMAIVFVVGITNVTAINPLAAALYARFEQQEDVLAQRGRGPLSLSEGGLWLRETVEGGNSVVHAGNVRNDGLTLLMRGVSIFVFEREDRFLKRIEAVTGSLQNDHFELQQAWVIQPGAPSVYHDLLHLPTTLTLGRIQENFASAQTVSFWQLPRFIRFFEAAGFSAHRHRLHLQTLIASPFLLCAMVLVAAAVSMDSSQRSGRLFQRILGGVVAGFLVFFFGEITQALGQSSTLPLWLAAWSPAIISGLIGLAFVFYFEDG